MRKKILAFVFAAAVLMAMAVPMFSGGGTASADVHGVSQAGCGKSANSGAIKSRDAIGDPGDPGRPAALIPVNASDGETKGKAGAAGAGGVNC